MIRKGDKLRILPQWQDDGDDEFEWFAVEDESGGRVLTRAETPDTAIYPEYVVKTNMVEKVEGL